MATTTTTTTPSASSTQIGGHHYTSMVIQPFEFIQKNEIGFAEGNVIKYVCRWKLKGGVEDLKKAEHYLQLLKESVDPMSKPADTLVSDQSKQIASLKEEVAELKRAKRKMEQNIDRYNRLQVRRNRLPAIGLK